MPQVTSNIDAARQMAALFRARGWNALPSNPGEKKPLCKFAEWWDRPIPEDLWDWNASTNLQVMTGIRWGLLVVDLDGEEAQRVWPTWGMHPRTWVTHSGGNGRHVWFVVPTTLAPLGKLFLWGQGDGSHSAIEVLCDRSLVMSPPSIHPRTGQRYRFANGCSPRQLSMPAAAPRWLLARAYAEQQRIEDERRAKAARFSNSRIVRSDGRAFRLRELVDATPDKAALAASWGLRIVGAPSESGWVKCRAIDREDRNPSASFNISTGVYHDFASGQSLGMIDLGLSLGAFSSVEDARDYFRARA